MKLEIRDVVGYNGLYQVDNFGKVWSVRGNYYLIQRINKYGYPIVDLHQNGQRTTWKVHRLVGMAFLSNPFNKPFVHHKDHNKKNNVVTNLEWVTHQENVDYAKQHGVLARGSKNGSSKLIEHQVIQIRHQYNNTGISIDNLCNRYNVSKTTIYGIVNNKTWTHV